MSALTAARDRRIDWLEVLELYGYVDVRASWENEARTAFRILARRPDDYGEPPVAVDIIEAWKDGRDPVESFRRSYQGAFMESGKAHAQFQDGDEGAARIDVGDTSKPVELTIHLHPLGQPNEVRLAVASIPIPEQWLSGIEGLACDSVGL